MSDTVEKIKQEGKTLADLDDLMIKTLDNHEEYEKLEQAKWVQVDDVLKILEDEKQKLLARLLKLTKPRAGSIYSIRQEEGMMLLLTELLVGVKPRSRDHVEGLLHNLKYGFTAKGPRSKTIKKLMELKKKS